VTDKVDQADDSNFAESKKRPLRSYVIRASRTTDSQRKALAEHWDKHVLPFEGGLLELDSAFPDTQPLTVEIGFGMGDSLLAMAAAEPQCNFLGIEVHQPGVGKLLAGLERHSLGNVKVVSHDAREVLITGLAPHSIDRLLIFFPDPWPKKRHHKRRLVQPGFMQLVASRLKPDGVVHLATDWEHYAQQMLEVIEADSDFENVNGAGSFWPAPKRPETKFERRGVRLGHGVWDLLFRRR